MPTSTQSLKSIFEQALLAKAAYANLSGIDFEDVDQLRDALKNTGSEHMPQYAAQYVGRPLRGPEPLCSGKRLFRDSLRSTRCHSSLRSQRADVTFAIRGTDDWEDRFGSWTSLLLQARPSASQLAEMYAQWDGLLNGSPGYELPASVRALLQTANVNVTGHSIGGALVTEFSAFRAERVGHAFTFNTATVLSAEELPHRRRQDLQRCRNGVSGCRPGHGQLLRHDRSRLYGNRSG